jgi:hypothetical protein
MIKKYFGNINLKYLEEQSMVMFQEVSDGIYFVVKDRTGIYPSYVTSILVADVLNNNEKIAVVHKGVDASGYANFELIKN